MARWTVVDGDQEIVLEAAADRDQLSLDIPAHKPFISNREVFADLRRKLDLAIGTADPEQVQS